MLTVQNLSKKVDKVSALRDVSFTIRPGEIMDLMGQNGAGKTTTFHSILNFLNYDGTITLQDQPITEKIFNTIGYLPEERSLLLKMTIEQQIVYLAKLKNRPTKEIKTQIDRWLKRFAVQDKIKTPSKGNQQKVQLICTLIHQPQLIILDEPFIGLDPVNADLLKNAVLDAKKRNAVIIFSSHDMSNVEEICDSLIMLKKRKVILSGSIDSVRNSFGKTEIFCKTTKSLAESQQLPHVKTVEQ